MSEELLAIKEYIEKLKIRLSDLEKRIDTIEKLLKDAHIMSR